MRFIKGMLFGIIVGALGYWFFQMKARQHPESEQRYEEAAGRVGVAAKETAHDLSDAFKAILDTLDLRPDQIKDEMARTGKIVRRSAQDFAGKVEDAASDARAVAAIKAKYAGDSDLSVWSISVSCHDGHVALSGTVPSAEGVGKAVALALQTDGVQDVTSTLQIKPKQ